MEESIIICKKILLHNIYNYIIIYILEFQKRVLRELCILSLKIDDISEIMNAVNTKKNKADATNKLSACSEAPDIIKLFPVNDDALVQLEDWLMSSEQNKTILVREIKIFLY